MKKFAVIDVGSNSVRLMFVADGKVLYKALNTTRLGEGLAEKPLLKAEAIERSAKAVAQFYAQAVNEGAEKVFAFATAAVRTAENRQDFIDSVQVLCGLQVEVISGEKEAEMRILRFNINGIREAADPRLICVYTIPRTYAFFSVLLSFVSVVITLSQI